VDAINLVIYASILRSFIVTLSADNLSVNQQNRQLDGVGDYYFDSMINTNVQKSHDIV
jgi:hypothetical protein